jgi:hypothetical protein
MAEQLRPEGTAVQVGEAVLRTPGLTGSVEVHWGAGAGMRTAEESAPALLQAMADAGMSEQLTVEIRDALETDAVGGSRSTGGPTDIELEVPGPGTGYAQVLLYSAEDGSLSWHLPVDFAPPDVVSRGGQRRTYRVPRQVVPREPADGGDRGVLGAIGKKLLKIIIFPLVDAVLGEVGDHFATRWEARHRPSRLRTFDPDNYQSDVATEVSTPEEWARFAQGPMLLLVHGTAAQSHTGFRRIPQDFFGELFLRYAGRVAAFDHPTISVTPTENVAWLASHVLPSQPLTVDVLAHSRGGLVGRALAHDGLGDRLRVRNLVMVGTPNAGTPLADKDRIGQWLNRMSTLVNLIPSNPVTDTLDVVLTVLKQVVVGAFGGLDGLMSMNPRGDYLRRLNTTTQPPKTHLRAVASNYEPQQGSPLLRVARDGVIDVVFDRTPNDLVVPTAGVYDVPGAPGFPVADPLVFDASKGVDHSSYWDQPRLAEALTRWLPG